MSFRKLFIPRLYCLIILLFAVAGPTSAAPLGSRPLEIGATGEDVAELQKGLAATGFYRGPVTGYYGGLTLSAVVAFQKANRLLSQGYVGELTVTALKAKLKPPKPTTHVVSVGETLSDIAAKYGLGTADLVRFNGLKNPNLLSIGQNLNLETPSKPVSAPKPSGPKDTAKPDNDTPLIVFQNQTPQAQPSQPVPSKILALTFDDGPDPLLTPKVLELLKKHRFRATFFVIGSQAEAQPELVKQIQAEGHEIANHSYSHRDLTQLDPDQLAAEFSRASQIITQLTGRSPSWFRPPLGAFDDRVISQSAKSNQRLALWTNIGPQDIPGPVLVRRVTSSIREGAVILLHDNRQVTIEALNQILPDLQGKGYRSVTLTEMVGAP